MTEPRIARRLAAILAADIAGYGRMMHADEAGTLAAIGKIWRETFNPAVAAWHGRIVKMMGDGALVEFASVVDAVECGVAIQHAMTERNRGADQAIAFRIGINLGDVLVEGDDIFGDGVNVAVRLEGQAPRGGVLVSDLVHSQVSGKVAIDFRDVGELRLKNITRPVRAWRWGGDEAPPRSELAAPRDKPSIAVLPFTVMSEEAEQHFFADGLVDDILTTLSKLSGLTVIARNSSFVYKGRAVDVRQVARELHVRYVLEGSVRKSADRARITTQLIDASTGAHVWADRFDRALVDIFAVQDEITLRLATEMQVRLTEGEHARLRYTTTTNVPAWNLWIEGLSYNRGPVTGENQIRARRCWEQALALDPNSAPLNAMLGFAHVADARFGWWDEREVAIAKSDRYIERALAIDPQNPDAHRARAGILLARARFDEAVAAVREAVACGPNFPDVLDFASHVLCCADRAAEAIPLIRQAMTLSPTYPANYLGSLGNALRLAGRTAEASDAFRAYHAASPGFGLADLAIIEVQAGRVDAARETVRQLLAARPHFTVSGWARTQIRSDTERMATDIAALRAASAPE
ncbi:MAG TPA: tetratricopeptide repeat protein [Stellaceae bacterium]|nr:tetratricopeptide repeat protein [Stellaceae bacterium]